jgi:radical SAM superfamily enzyme YgiQ (UPF0313 family)
MQIIIFTDINGNYGFGRNLGAYTIASYLRQNNISAQVVDFFSSLREDEVKQICKKYISNDTKFVCFSNTFFQSVRTEYSSHKKDIIERFSSAKYFPHSDEYMIEMISYIRSINKDIKFVMGGKKTRLDRDNSLIDHWIVGDGETSIFKLVTGRTQEKILRYEYLGFEDFKMVWSKNDYIMDGEALPIEFSRGCPFRCAFCATEKRRTNEGKSAEIIKSELLYNYEKFKTTRYMIVDLTFNETPERTKMYCDIFKSLPFKIEWSAVARLDLMYKNPWMADEMLQAGAKAIWFGIESFNKKALSSVQKLVVDPMELKDYTYILKEKWKDKVVFGSLFIVGLPGETEESLNETLNWIVDKDCPLDAAAFFPLSIREPGNDDQIYSFIANDMKKYGYIWHQKEWINIHTGMTQRRAGELAVKFSDEILKYRKLPPVYFYTSRLKTLGFTENDMKNMRMDYGDSFIESEKRREVLKNKYLKILLQ